MIELRKNKTNKIKWDPYKEATPEQRKEYDSFGPWLQEIREEADIPPCFKAFYKEYAEARFLIKFPINVERRKTFPGAELYRSVLAVDEKTICLLYREGSQVLTRSISIKEIRAIYVYQSLLYGELSLIRDNGTRFEIKYNTVSQPIIEAIVDFLRARFPPKPGIRESWQAVEVNDFFFQSILEEQTRRQASIVPLHCEVPGRRTIDTRGRRRIYLGILALGTERDLVMIDQGKTLRRRREAVYACRINYIPWAALNKASEADPESVRSVEYRSLVLGIGSSSLRYDLFEPAALLSQLARAVVA